MFKNFSAKYYRENKEKLVKKNLSEDEKQNLVEYRKKYDRLRKNALL